MILSSNLLRKLPPNIGQLQKLRVLDLAENRIDNIPNEIGRLRVLQKLILQTNSLSQLPRAIGYASIFRKHLAHIKFNYRTETIVTFTCAPALIVLQYPQAIVETGVPLCRREHAVLLARGDRLSGVPRIAVHQRQPNAADAAIRARALLQARDHVHRELSTEPNPHGNCAGRALACHSGELEG